MAVRMALVGGAALALCLRRRELPASGYQRAAGPEFELYGEAFNPEDSTSEFHAYVPVSKG